MRAMQTVLFGAPLLCAMMLGGCASAGTSGAGAPAAITITPEMIAEGRTLYTGAGRCGVCHGPMGRGGRLGPNLTDDTWIWVDTAQDFHTQVFNIIKNGVPEARQTAGGIMPAMGGGSLTDVQIHALAAYVATL